MRSQPNPNKRSHEATRIPRAWELVFTRSSHVSSNNLLLQRGIHATFVQTRRNRVSSNELLLSLRHESIVQETSGQIEQVVSQVFLNCSAKPHSWRIRKGQQGNYTAPQSPTQTAPARPHTWLLRKAQHGTSSASPQIPRARWRHIFRLVRSPSDSDQCCAFHISGLVMRETKKL